MKKIVLFNHKGGVSKTTTAFHLGWKLTDQSKKVLLVDGDSQCNLTSLFLGERFDSYYEDEKTSRCNIKDGVSMVFEGQPRPIEAFDCPVSQDNPNLYLLPGHMNLSEYESSLAFSLASSVTLTSLKNLPGAFNQLITVIAEKYSIDYVIIDLNPALSSLNEVLFLSSDAFIIPVNPDSFAVMALTSLAHILPKWGKWTLDNSSMFLGATYALPETLPKFLGVIPQRFNIRNGVATRPYRDKINELNKSVMELLFPELVAARMTFKDEEYRRAHIPESMVLGEIKDFQGLAPQSQKYNVPVYKLSDEQLGANGAPLEKMKESRSTFDSLYQEICQKITALLE